MHIRQSPHAHVTTITCIICKRLILLVHSLQIPQLNEQFCIVFLKNDLHNKHTKETLRLLWSIISCVNLLPPLGGSPETFKSTHKNLLNIKFIIQYGSTVY